VPADPEGQGGRHPRGHVNAGYLNYRRARDGVLRPDEQIAGVAAGKRLAAAGKKNVLCVLQPQGQAQLEAGARA